MNAEVRNLGSIYSTYISTVDHLPCDIVRSLWLVQALNFKAELASQTIHEKLLPQDAAKILKDAKNSSISEDFVNARNAIIGSHSELLAEMQALVNQLESHYAILEAEVKQLQVVAETPQTQERSYIDAQRELLEQHYKEHPLESQINVGSITERVVPGILPVVIKKVLKNSKSKIILKFGSSNKLGTQSVTKVAKPRVEHVWEEPKLSEEEKYCFCGQNSFGAMIGCDNKTCPNGEWFHYKCVGLIKADAPKYAKQRWFCLPECREAGNRKKKTKRRW